MSLFPNLVNRFSSLLNAPWTIFKDRVTFTKNSIHQLPAWNITPHKSKTILMLFLKKKVPKKLSWLSYSKKLPFWTKFTSLWFFSQSSWAQNGSHHIQELQKLSKERKRKLKQRRERCVKENRICCFFDWRLWSIRKWRGRGYLELSATNRYTTNTQTNTDANTNTATDANTNTNKNTNTRNRYKYLGQLGSGERRGILSYLATHR